MKLHLILCKFTGKHSHSGKQEILFETHLQKDIQSDVKFNTAIEYPSKVYGFIFNDTRINHEGKPIL